jgi:hypothetical protein
MLKIFQCLGKYCSSELQDESLLSLDFCSWSLMNNFGFLEEAMLNVFHCQTLQLPPSERKILGRCRKLITNLAVGEEWEAKDMTRQTKEQCAIKWEQPCG